MRTRFVSVIVVAIVCLGTEALLGNKSAANEALGGLTVRQSGLTVRQSVDSEVLNLSKNLRLAKGADAQVKILEKSLNAIKSIRSKNPRQFEQDEVYMDTLYFSLSEIPAKKPFGPEQCQKAKSSILAEYSPKHESEPTPAINQTLTVLSSVCK